MLERPPILQGNTNDQVRLLHDYLMRLASTLDGSIQAATSLQNVTTKIDENGRQVLISGGAESRTAAEIKKSAEELKALILKSAEDSGQIMEEYVNSKTEEYQSMFVAQSDYGEFVETIDSRIETTARGTIESYNYDALIQGIEEANGEIQQYLENLNGQIRRGIVWDPTALEYVTGIAISQDLKFTGNVCTPDDENNPGDGYTYFYMESGQTFGLYTSTGWQFWIQGVRKGYFDAQAGVLRVYDMVVEGKLTIGNVRFDMSTRFDIKPIGV